MRKIKTYQSFTESASADLRDSIEDLGYEEKGAEISSGGEITEDISKIAQVILDLATLTNIEIHLMLQPEGIFTFLINPMHRR